MLQIFGIAQKSRFDIKSMAGNIIPAIATTNAVIAGCIVMEGLKILQGKSDRCKTVSPFFKYATSYPGEIRSHDP
jgi:ubiquitin-like 1-activating enzyme E1 B